MGYEFHITRADSWVESEADPITADEWLEVVEADPELRIDPDNGRPTVLWFSPGGNPDGVQLWWSDGQIQTKHPDQATVRKMIGLADFLGATVQGDDGETYSSADNWPLDDERAAKQRAGGE